MNQRKIFHYNDSFGDHLERSHGHCTYASSIISGKQSSDGRNEDAGHADDTALASQLTFYGMANGYTGITNPSVDRLLKSLYNSKGVGNKGSCVINASWGRSCNGQYTSFCCQYNKALQSQYPDLLFLVLVSNMVRSGALSGSC